MPPKKKAGGKKGKSGASAAPKEPLKEYVQLEVSNCVWRSMRLTLTMSTDEPISNVIDALQKFHHVGTKSLKLYVGGEVEDSQQIDLASNPTLKAIGIVGGSPIFDGYRARITYDFLPYRSVLNLPVHTFLI
jgi:hypothetical protein